MVFVVLMRTALFLSVLFSFARHLVEGHSWIDCIDTDRSKIYDQSASYIFGGAGGNGFCAGYGAGYPGRGSGDIGPAYTYKLLKNEVEAGAPVCQNVGANAYTDWRKRLVIAPGQTAYYTYLPNGHVVKDKKGVGTQHGIYWTGQVGTSLSSTRDITPERLLIGQTLDFDDGNCGETLDTAGNPSNRAGDGKPCVGHFIVPVGTAPGIYSMVWFWTFWLDNPSDYKDQETAAGYFGAAYSTCFEVEVTASGAPPIGGETATQQTVPTARSADPPTPPATTPPPTPAPPPPTPAPSPPTPASPPHTPAPSTPAPPIAAPPPAKPSPASPIAAPPPAKPSPVSPIAAKPTPIADPALMKKPPLPGEGIAPAPEPTTPAPPVPASKGTPTYTTPEMVPAPATQISLQVPAATPGATTPSPPAPTPKFKHTGKGCRTRMRS